MINMKKLFLGFSFGLTLVIVLLKLPKCPPLKSVLVEADYHQSNFNPVRSITEEKRSFADSTSTSHINNTKERRFPDAIIIGVMKGGTTALQWFLDLHPDIVMAGPREQNFFSLPQEYAKGLKYYKNNMPMSTRNQIVMEKSQYFGSIYNHTVQNIYKFNPNIKMVVILRNPVTRTISHYNMKHKRVRYFKDKSIEDLVIDKRTGKVRPEVLFIQRSMYYYHMLQFVQYFPVKQIYIADGDNFINHPLETLVNITRHLGLPTYYNHDTFYYDEKKGFYCFRKISENEPNCLPRATGLKHVPIANKTMDKLRKFFRPLNEKFFELIGRRFDWN